MAITSLQFRNKNQFRKYPVKQGLPFQADDSTVVPDDLIVNCTITTLYGKHRLYIRQIYHNGGAVRITIASVFDDTVLGMFFGDVTTDFTTLPLIPFVRNLSGSITVGSAVALASITNTLHFTKDSAELEESTIFCYTPPAVSSILDKKNTELRGDVNFGILTNLKKSNTVAKTTQFTISNPAAVFNLADKSTYLDNCPNPIIKTINEVAPYPIGGENNLPGNDGNIYIVGVSPVVFYGVPATITTGYMIVGAGIEPNTFVVSGNGNFWQVNIAQTTNTDIPAKVFRLAWQGKAYLAGETLYVNSTELGTLAAGDLITGPGIAADTYITDVTDTSTYTITPAQGIGSSDYPLDVLGYEPTWSGTVSTVEGTTSLNIISTTPGTSKPAGVPGALNVQTPGVSLDSLCTQKHKLLPPTDICGFTDTAAPDTYYSKPALGATGSDACSGRPARPDGSYYSTTRPEYYFWPQFVKPEYYTTYWNTLN